MPKSRYKSDFLLYTVLKFFEQDAFKIEIGNG